MARYGFAFFDSGVRFDSPDAHDTTMKDLHSFLENPFDDTHISLDNLLAFTTDHVQRLTNNNATGDFTARITATTSALGLLDTKATEDLTDLGLREAQVLNKDNYRKTLPAAVGKVAAAVAARYGEKTAQMLECFPQGRSIFSTCRDDKLEAHLQTLITAVTAYQADLGAPTVVAAQALLAGWLAVYHARNSASGVKGAAEQSKRYARENLQLMLFLNLLKIAEVYARQPDKLDTYMQQSLLTPHTHHAPATPPTTTPPTPPA
jgi:hypothetical protein